MTSRANLDDLFGALADPTRRAIVARLASGGEATVLELAAPFDISLPAISRHLKVLEKAGLISRGRDAQKRPCRLEAGALDEINRWTQHTKRAWEQRFDELDDYLKKLQQTPPTPTKNERKKRHARKRP
jgi:DNA-binding transcriptional ArsR family regulator